MALSKLAANSFDLTDNYALTGTVTGVVSTQKIFLIKNIDASSSSTVDFVDGASSVDLDNTYKTYLFKFINIHSASDNVNLTFNGSSDGGSNYNVTKTTTLFSAFHSEADDNTGVTYAGSLDTAQGTGHQVITWQVGNDNDHSINGELYLFNPSSTTFVKHFMSRASATTYHNYERDSYMSGYFNTTSVINAIQFKMSSGNIDSGRIALYGIK